MKESHKREKRFNFSKYQNAKKSRRMLIRFIIYSIVIAFILFLIMQKSQNQNNQEENNSIENFEIE